MDTNKERSLHYQINDVKKMLNGHGQLILNTSQSEELTLSSAS